MGIFPTDLFRSLFGRKPQPREPRAEPGAQQPRRKVTKIERNLVRLITEVSRATHPHEFAAGLKAEGDTLTELVLMPTLSGPTSAHMQLWSLPIDRSTVGTVHSHPGSIPFPSGADKELFAHFGHTHIIIAEPYGATHWRAWDHRAQPIRLDVVD